MDLDLVLVRSFVVTAEELHLRQAADRLFITQQALAQRIQRLEDGVGLRLFRRTTQGVELTGAGQEFLSSARDLLAIAKQTAAKVLNRDMRPLRIDVVDERLSPLRLVHRLLAEEPGVPLKLTMHHALATALPNISAGSLDAAFGWVDGVTGPWPSGIKHRLIRLEPLAALIPKDHPLADRHTLHPKDLRSFGLWTPHYSDEWEHYLQEFSAAFDVALTISDTVASDSHFLAGLKRRQPLVCLGGVEVSSEYMTASRVIPLIEPTPVYPWSLAWRADDPHPLISRLLEFAEETAVDYVPGEHWLPPLTQG
ncbi:LysR family transcriptional regulator [Kibdelosporangium philippinense]|uniref:LysR family transcriptional regulator n=1 Tax=Kibdelosporangium philippinense TaxID=211113 RepID=A0ABS8ZGI0_9PSEU|nr:LysR family transcriptional regulator [Kibdelosporangium philippinense]MCE7006890.1 LysR family transcriptional regulator [Kibdelosporangium philippinense]